MSIFLGSSNWQALSKILTQFLERLLAWERLSIFCFVLVYVQILLNSRWYCDSVINHYTTEVTCFYTLCYIYIHTFFKLSFICIPICFLFKVIAKRDSEFKDLDARAKSTSKKWVYMLHIRIFFTNSSSSQLLYLIWWSLRHLNHWLMFGLPVNYWMTWCEVTWREVSWRDVSCIVFDVQIFSHFILNPKL